MGDMKFHVAAILFDIDGTLVDSTPAVNRAWTGWAEDHGINPGEVLAVCPGRRSEDTIAEYVPEQDVAAEVVDMERREAADVDSVVALPGTRDILSALPARQWAAVTSGSRALMRARLAATGLPEPDVLITGDDVNAGKPDPQGYHLAAAELGVDARDCLIIEDAPVGLGAARGADGTVLAVGTSHPVADLAALGLADAVVADLTAITVEQTPTGLTVTVP